MGFFQNSLKKNNKIYVWILILVIILLTFVLIVKNSIKNNLSKTNLENLYKLDEKNCMQSLEKISYISDKVPYIYKNGTYGVIYDGGLLPGDENRTRISYYIIGKPVYINGIPHAQYGIYFYWGKQGFEGCKYTELDKSYDKWFDRITKCKYFNYSLYYNNYFDNNYAEVGNEIFKGPAIYREISLISKTYIHYEYNIIQNAYIHYMEKNECKVII